MTQVVEIPQVPTQPNCQMKQRISNNLLELRKIKSVPLLSLCESPLYRRRKWDTPSTDTLSTSPIFPAS